MTPYNARAGLQKAARAGKHILKDPGDGGTIVATPGDPCVCVITGGTTRALDSAATYPLQTRVLVVSQTSSITVSGVAGAQDVALAAGEYVEVLCTRDSAGVNQWSPASMFPIDLGTYTFLATATAQDAVDGILAIVEALNAAGLVDGSRVTQAP